MGTTLVVITILSIVILSESPEAMANSGGSGISFGCNRVYNETYVIQKDENGKRCWGFVTIWGCRGYCLSVVRGDWNFPHKIYKHQVCIHDQLEERVQNLTSCEVGVLPGTWRYTYFDAGSCKCASCNSSNASCEGGHKRGGPSPPIVPEGNDYSEVPVPSAANTEDAIRPLFSLEVLPPPVYP